MKTTERGGPRGYYAGERIKGRKRHIVTDKQGNLVGLIVHKASIQDRDGAPRVLASIRYRYPCLRHIFADGGYAGDKLRQALKVSENGRQKSSSGPTVHRASRFCHADGSSNKLLVGSVAVADWQRISRRQSPASLLERSSLISVILTRRFARASNLTE